MINQPGEEILAVSPVFQNKIIALRKQISDKETEVQRLNKDIISLSYTNEQLVLQEKELKEVLLPELETKKDNLSKEIKQLSGQNDELKKSIQALDNEIRISKEEIQKRIEEVSASEKIVEEKMNNQNNREVEIAKKEIKLKELETSLNLKIDKLKAIIWD